MLDTKKHRQTTAILSIYRIYYLSSLIIVRIGWAIVVFPSTIFHYVKLDYMITDNTNINRFTGGGGKVG